MSEPVTIWERHVSRDGYPGYFAPGSESWLWGREVDERRRAKHLTDAEAAAMYWAAEASRWEAETKCLAVGGPPTTTKNEARRLVTKRRNTLHRFATNDQAV